MGLLEDFISMEAWACMRERGVDRKRDSFLYKSIDLFCGEVIEKSAFSIVLLFSFFRVKSRSITRE